jgi:hypothetical protein
MCYVPAQKKIAITRQTEADNHRNHGGVVPVVAKLNRGYGVIRFPQKLINPPRQERFKGIYDDFFCK